MTVQTPVLWSGPICGLGNRMVALAAVRACVGDRAVRFLWSNDASCPGAYEEVFVESETFASVAEHAPSADVINTGWEPYGIYEAFRAALDLDLSREDFSRKLVVALGDLPFHHAHLEAAKEWRAEQGKQPLIGVHIRRTDRTAQHRQQFRDFLMRKSGLNRELPLFLSALYGVAPASFMRRVENATLFSALRKYGKDGNEYAVSTFADDDAEALDFAQALTRSAPGVEIHKSPEAAPLQWTQGVRRTSLTHAMIDLLCLSQCDAIAQNNRASTFSLVAAIVGRKPILTAKTRYPFWQIIEDDTGAAPNA